MSGAREQRVGALLFEGFELLDLYGPLEVFGNAPRPAAKGERAFEIVTLAERAGPVPSAQGPAGVADTALDLAPPLDLLLVPGGIGTRREVANAQLLAWLRARAASAEYVTSVCTGAALLAAAGILDGRRATTNKRAFAWVREQGPRVRWVERARWVEDGNVFTASGVSAGTDMALALVGRILGPEVRDALARGMEYTWHADPDDDPFAKSAGPA